MKKKRTEYESKDENAFALSTGDLMASLLFIFILLLMGALLQVQEKAEQDEEIVKRYDQIKTQLYIDLQQEFKDDLAVWRATLDSTLCIRFQEPSMLFDEGQSLLKPKFKNILDDFFPRFLEIVSNEKYRESIEEIRIEGHTDSDGGYLYNIQLSQDRAREVLNHCLNIVSGNDTYSEMIEWAKFKITANGLSFSHPILNADSTENKGLSRRVEFKIRTNAEKQLEEIAKIRR